MWPDIGADMYDMTRYRVTRKTRYRDMWHDIRSFCHRYRWKRRYRCRQQSSCKGYLVTLEIERFNCNIVIYRYRRSNVRYRTLPRFQMSEETADRQLAKDVDRKKRAAETRRRRKADRAWGKIEVCSAHVHTSYVEYRTSMYSVHTKYKLSILTHWSTQ